MIDLRELYQEVILDHNRNPRNCHKMDNANRQADGFNPLCGDKLTLYLIVEDSVIKDVSFEGCGCAISTASASLMTEFLKGKTEAEAEAMFNDFRELVTNDDAHLDKDKMGKLAILGGVKDYPSRVKCATLAWHTLEAALKKIDGTATTE